MYTAVRQTMERIGEFVEQFHMIWAVVKGDGLSRSYRREARMEV